MAVNIFRDEMQHARLFGKPVLTTNWLISRETVPDEIGRASCRERVFRAV